MVAIFGAQILGILLCLLASTAAFGQQSLNSSMVAGRDYVDGEVIVKLKGSSASLSASTFMGNAQTGKHHMHLKKSWSGLNMHHFALGSRGDLKETLRDLKDDPAVEYAEPNYIIRLDQVSQGSAGAPPDDGSQQSQGIGELSGGVGILSTCQNFAQTTAPIDRSDAWAAMSGGKTPPVVAVIDTGLDLTHAIFTGSNAIWTNPGETGVDIHGNSKTNNGIDDDSNGYIDDVHGWNFVSNNNSPQDDASPSHGTHVSGIILGTTQNIWASPIAAASIKIMPLKFLDSTGSGTTSNAVTAIYYAANNGAKVMNNSWGGGGFSSSLLDALTYAYNKKIAVVVAAGNSGTNNDTTPMYPASYTVPNIISVAATNDSDFLAGFSDYGASTVHVASPGVSIYSTITPNTCGYLSGTSMATPFVAGIAALMMREAPTMNGYQVKNLIMGATDHISNLSGRVASGGRVNVYESLLSSQSTVVDGSQPNYDAAAVERSLASDDGDSAAGCGRVHALNNAFDNSGEGPSGPIKSLRFFALLLTLVSPILFNVFMRTRNREKNRRRHPRYQIESQVRLKFGEKEMVGSVSTISLGGVQLNTEALLEQGGIVTMTIASPDGKDQIQVQGQIVWTEEQKHYGVQFSGAEDTVVAAISRWTQNLLKAS